MRPPTQLRRRDHSPARTACGEQFPGAVGWALADCAPDMMFSPATNTALSTVVAKESVPFKLAGAFPYVQVTG